MKIITVIGSRPQFIKISAMCNTIKKYNNIEHIIIHTGQHFDFNMSQIFFKDLEIQKPKYNLNINCLNHGAMVGKQIEKIEKILISEKPEFVIVYGDTNATLSGAIAASKLNMRVVHIEAGLRSFNKDMPEEINRILVDHCSEFLFVPTKNAENNLINEGININNIFLVGDIMYEVYNHYGNLAQNSSKILDQLKLKPKEYYLVTIHRQETTENIEKLICIIDALSESPKKIIFPIHPRTKNIIEKYNMNYNNIIEFIDPIGYMDMAKLQKNAKKIITDSGGMQKEAYFYKVPCITLREETEWVELVEKNVNVLVGSCKSSIIDKINTFEPNNFNYSFYGMGNTSVQIIETLYQNY